MPIDIAAHRAQVAQWRADLAEAQAALHAASRTRDVQRPCELQLHLQDVLDEEAFADWPRTDTGKLVTRRRSTFLREGVAGLASRDPTGRPPVKARAALAVAEEILSARVADRPNWTLPRLSSEIERRTGVKISKSRLSVVLRKKGA